MRKLKAIAFWRSQVLTGATCGRVTIIALAANAMALHAIHRIVGESGLARICTDLSLNDF